VDALKKTALITGGAKRIGRALALALAKDGYRIALHCHQSKTLAIKTANEINSRGGQCEIFVCDLSSEQCTSKLIPAIHKKYPGLELLINNASLFVKSKLRTKDLSLLTSHWDINVRAPYILSCDFSHVCRKGQIINILDTHIVKNRSPHSAYLLSKKSLAELTKLCAFDFAPHIRVNAICPGLILPPPNKEKTYLDRLAKEIPLRRKGNVNNVVQSVEFLIKNDFITGQIIFVDGGEHLL
jgi:pteridine reductase